MQHLRVTQALSEEQAVSYDHFGIVGDGVTPDDSGMSSLLQACADYGLVTLGGAPAMLLTQTLRFSARSGMALISEREPNADYRNDGKSGVFPQQTPWFLWGGDAGGDMVSLDVSKRITLDGFVFATEDIFGERAPAGRAIVLDGGPDTQPDANAFGTSCTLRRLRHWTSPTSFQRPARATRWTQRRLPGTYGVRQLDALLAQLQAQGISVTQLEQRRTAAHVDAKLAIEATFITIAQATKWNQEFHEIIECAGNGNNRGRFLHIGPSYNAKNIKLTGSRYIDAYPVAVQVDNGSLKLQDNNMSFNGFDLSVGFATGFIREIGHIGEHSAHHMIMNAPYVGFDNTFDPQALAPRTTYIEDPFYPKGDANYHGSHPNAWILFGPRASVVKLSESMIGAVPSSEARIFGFMFDGMHRRIELGPFEGDDSLTLRTMGLSDVDLYGSADTSAGYYPFAGQVLYHDRVRSWNPHGPAVQDLFCGELQFYTRGVREAGAPTEYQIPLDKRVNEPTTIRVADAAQTWDRIIPGTLKLYRTLSQVRFQHTARGGERAQGVVGQASATPGNTLRRLQRLIKTVSKRSR